MKGPSPAGLIELAAGHQRARVLTSLIELGIPTLLGEEPRSRETVAASLGAEPLAVGLLLEAAARLGVLVRTEGGFANSPAAARFLRRESPDYLGDLLLRHDRMARSPAWTGFPRRLLEWRAGTSAPVAPEAAPTLAERDGQHRVALLAGEALGESFDFSTFRLLLDLGGGTGAMSIALCRLHSGLSAIVVERPEIAAATHGYVDGAGLRERIGVRAEDFLNAAPWPEGADLVLLANVLSMLPAERTRELFGRIHRYLPRDGAVVLSGLMPSPGGAGGPLEPLLLGLEDIALGVPDIERPAEQYMQWLAAAGFRQVRHAAYYPPASMVVGRKSG